MTLLWFLPEPNDTALTHNRMSGIPVDAFTVVCQKSTT